TFCKNSLFLEIMALFVLRIGWQGETSCWGSAVVGIEQLAPLGDVDVICFVHENEAALQQLMRSPLWQSLPFVRAGRFQRVPAVWYYGATLSALHFVRVLERALETH
ncbi:MAG TPA: Fe(3+)-hydroxamate ABC transporter substrate-binding protein FhuD, partial [Pantoea sp.]|nr:Fe(3+)-hydroxamate ABC transporter substrate-binding protein FhuD [Pantoea sp.]